MMIRIGTATDDDDDGEWRESRSTVRGVLAGFESTRQKPTRLLSGVRPPFSLDGPIHLPVIDDAAVVGSGRLSNDPPEIGGRTTRDRAGIRRAQTPRWRDIDGRARVDRIHP